MWLSDKFCLLFRQLEYMSRFGRIRWSFAIRNAFISFGIFFSVLVHFSCAEGEVPFQTWACPGCQVWSTPCCFLRLVLSLKAYQVVFCNVRWQFAKPSLVPCFQLMFLRSKFLYDVSVSAPCYIVIAWFPLFCKSIQLW